MARQRKSAERVLGKGAARKPRRRMDYVLESLESRIAPAFSGTVAGTIATWAGDAAGNNLRIDQTAGVLQHNQPFLAATPGIFNSAIDFDSAVLGDQTVPAAAGSEFRVSIVSGANDTVQFGSAAAGVDQLGGARMTVIGLGNDPLDRINALFSNNPVTVTYDGDTLTGSGANVDFTTANFAGGFFISTGNGADVINVTGTEAGDPLNIDAGGGANTINVGASGSTANILANVNTTATGGSFLLNVNNTANVTGQTITINNGSISGIAPASILHDAITISGVVIGGGSGGNTFNVNFTANNTNFVVQTRINAGAGNDTVNVLGTSGLNGANLLVDGEAGVNTVNIGNAGSAQGIAGAVATQSTGGSFDLNIDDSADATGRTVGINNGLITGIAPANITHDLFRIRSVTVGGGTGGNTFNVNLTATTTTSPW